MHQKKSKNKGGKISPHKYQNIKKQDNKDYQKVKIANQKSAKKTEQNQ